MGVRQVGGFLYLQHQRLAEESAPNGQVGIAATQLGAVDWFIGESLPENWKISTGNHGFDESKLENPWGFHRKLSIEIYCIFLIFVAC